jgi:hypothetical protein
LTSDAKVQKSLARARDVPLSRDSAAVTSNCHRKVGKHGNCILKQDRRVVWTVVITALCRIEMRKGRIALSDEALKNDLMPTAV